MSRPAKRIIPYLLVNEGRTESMSGEDRDGDANDPIEWARYYEAAGADELIVHDNSTSRDRTQALVELAAKLAGEVFLPLAMGGGVDSLTKARALIRAGADKVTLSAGTTKDLDLLRDVSECLGPERVVLAIDTRTRSPDILPDTGRIPSGQSIREWVQKTATIGIGEVLLTTAGEGNQGFDLDLVGAVAATAGEEVPVLVAGANPTSQQISELFQVTPAAGAVADLAFRTRETSIRRVKRHCQQAGISIRPIPEHTLRVTPATTGRLPRNTEVPTPFLGSDDESE